MADPIENQAHAACGHPRQYLEQAIAHVGDPDWAYCYRCAEVLHCEGGQWVVQSGSVA